MSGPLSICENVRRFFKENGADNVKVVGENISHYPVHLKEINCKVIQVTDSHFGKEAVQFSGKTSGKTEDKSFLLQLILDEKKPKFESQRLTVESPNKEFIQLIANHQKNNF